ncbi:MAG: HAMP domain-containing histidine kinase [Acidimicrobiia bacterium]|nr:HAMP domain-containing histidine kinase [Acidimicrobiia bacterium]
MSFRTRVTLLVALAVAVSVTLVALVAWLAARNELVDQIDASLASRVEGDPGGWPGHQPHGGPIFGADETAQIIDSDGDVVRPRATPLLPVDDADIALAAGADPGTARTRTVEIDGEPYRVLTAALSDGFAVQIATPLSDTYAFLRRLGVTLVVIAVVGVLGACVLGFAVAWRSITPVVGLRTAAEHVAVTQDLSATIDIDRNDEIGRLASAFNAMLGALDESRTQQRQLVEDASHELRTPLTALRMNIDMLARGKALNDADQAEILVDVRDELEELTVLVGELVDLATDPTTAEEQKEDVRLDVISARAARRAARRTGIAIVVDAVPTTVFGSSASLERAVANLVDNACKFSPVGGQVVLTVGDGRVAVADEGEGIPAADLPHIFDRFFRSEQARSVPGSGLGLSIVRQIVEGHDGCVFAENAPSGGAVVGFDLPDVEQGAVDAPMDSASSGDQ